MKREGFEQQPQQQQQRQQQRQQQQQPPELILKTKHFLLSRPLNKILTELVLLLSQICRCFKVI